MKKNKKNKKKVKKGKDEYSNVIREFLIVFTNIFNSAGREMNNEFVPRNGGYGRVWFREILS